MPRAVAGAFALLLATSPGVSADPVDDAALAAAPGDGHDWLGFGHGYTNQRYSALATINRDTVARLAPAWIYQSGRAGTFQAQPLVSAGVMYVTLPGNDLVALDAATGRERWRYRHESRLAKTLGGPANRGAALGYGLVYQATNDGRLIALDAADGSLAWQALVATPTAADRAGLDPAQLAALERNVNSLPVKMQPLVYDGMVIVGVISAGYGIHYNVDSGLSEGPPPAPDEYLGLRGYVAAFDARTGKELWRWHTIRAGGWEGPFAATTPGGEPLPRDLARERAAAPALRDAWRKGGGSTWSTPAVDPELGLLYLGTGNASPNDVEALRPGDNLYANSLVALDAATGEVRWYAQHVPHDLWGYDVASSAVLFDLPRERATVPAVGVAGKTGWFYVHDRRSGELLYRSEPFVPQYRLFEVPTAAGVLAAPGSFGGASWSPVSFDPTSGLVFIPAIHQPTRFFLKQAGGHSVIVTDPAADQPTWGLLSALDTRAGGAIRWQVKTAQPLVGGVLATAGGLVFMGEGDGTFAAFDAATGERLWQFNCGAGVNAPPVSYAVDGRQFVAVAAGGHALFGYPAGDALVAFALVGEARR